MYFLKSFLIIFLCLINYTWTSAQPSNVDGSVEEMITKNVDTEDTPTVQDMIISYVEDYRNDRFAAEAMLFGVEVPDHGQWTVEVTGQKLNDTWEVEVRKGLPKTPTFIYNIEYETLVGIYDGQLNALTAQGKAFSGDYTPMSIDKMEGYKPSKAEEDKVNPFSFHFWTKGFPEMIPFREGMTRRAHGSNFVVFYYEKGLRTAWYRVQPEEKVRHDPREQAMPFPMMIVAIKGTTKGEVDGQPVSLSEGNTIFIPPFANHKWWNETNEATEAILIMFGEGA